TRPILVRALARCPAAHRRTGRALYAPRGTISARGGDLDALLARRYRQPLVPARVRDCQSGGQFLAAVGQASLLGPARRRALPVQAEGPPSSCRWRRALRALHQAAPGDRLVRVRTAERHIEPLGAEEPHRQSSAGTDFTGYGDRLHGADRRVLPTP